MTDIAVAAEAVGKSYVIKHRSAPRYTTLRDTLTEGAGRLLRRRGPDGGDTSEEFWALKDLSFDVREGEVVGIIGSNGAGKSTLLKVLSRITAPTTGRVRIRGRVASLLEVGTGFHPELSGRENIFLNGAVLGMSRAETRRKFDEIVAFAEVDRFLDTPVKRYSSGMYVRLAFAIAAHLEPEILIVDEVLAVGDAAFQRRCLGKMNAVATQEGRTVLFVSHNMSAVRTLCSTAMWLSRGASVMQGPCRQVVDGYLRSVLDRGESSIDLDCLPRAQGHGERMRLLNVEFNGGNAIEHGEPLRVRIQHRVTSSVNAAAVGFGFSSLDGVRIMSVDSDLDRAAPDLPAGTLGYIEAQVPRLDLQPGRYTFDIGARSGSDSALDYLGSCAEIEVLPGPNTPPLIIRDSGGMRIPAHWRSAGTSDDDTSTTGSLLRSPSHK
jgi:lipopolysaccharide transport system ATP-binding protein